MGLPEANSWPRIQVPRARFSEDFGARGQAQIGSKYRIGYIGMHVEAKLRRAPYCIASRLTILRITKPPSQHASRWAWGYTSYRLPFALN